MVPALQEWMGVEETRAHGFQALEPRWLSSVQWPHVTHQFPH